MNLKVSVRGQSVSPTHLEQLWVLRQGHERQVAPVRPAGDGHPIQVQVAGDGAEPAQDLDLVRQLDLPHSMPDVRFEGHAAVMTPLWW